jgi:hypothetical protein
MAHCLGPERADKVYRDRLGLESLPVEILDDLFLIRLHKVPKRTGQTYENRNLEGEVANLRRMQSPYQVGVFGEGYISSQEFCFRSRELTFGGNPGVRSLGRISPEFVEGSRAYIRRSLLGSSASV